MTTDFSRFTPRAAEALREAADHIEANPDNYDWHIPEQCNCGILAQKLTGLDTADLNEALSNGVRCNDEYIGHYGLWRSFNAEQAAVCQTTGLTVTHIAKHLIAEGFTNDDLDDIESLGNSDVLSVTGTFTDARYGMPKAVPENVVRYFRAMADLITEAHAVPA
jgi:hypothetical protein